MKLVKQPEKSESNAEGATAPDVYGEELPSFCSFKLHNHNIYTFFRLDDARLRSMSYVAVAKIASKLPHLVANDIALLQSFFQAICKVLQ